MSKSFKKAKEVIGLNDDNITPYSLRHTHTSYLLSKGISIEYISKRLIHYTISQTLNTYSHLLEEHKKSKVNESENYFLDTYLTLARMKSCKIKVLKLIFTEGKRVLKTYNNGQFELLGTF